MKIGPRKINYKDKIKYLDILYTAIAVLKSREEVKNFLKDLLTEGERIMLGRRIVIAQKLLRDISYEQIATEMKVGFDTITRVHRWLGDEMEGYEKAIRELELEFFNRKKLKDESDPGYDKFSFKGLKRRYPFHFFLFNLLDDAGKEK